MRTTQDVSDLALVELGDPGRPRADDLRLHVLIEVAESISSADGLDRALNRLAWLALKATGADRSAILVPDSRDPRQVRPAAGASRVGDLSVLWERFRSMEPINIDTDLRRPSIWQSTNATVIEDVASSSIVPESWKGAWGSKSIAYAPLRVGGEVFGILAVDYAASAHRFMDDEVKLLEAIAVAAGVALRSASLVEKLQRSITIERRLTECSAALLTGRSLDEALDEIADRFASLLPDSACGINLLSADGMGFRLVAWRGGVPRRKEIRISELPEDEVSAIRDVWKKAPRQPIVVADIKHHDGWEPFVPSGITSGMLVPLVEGREILGFVAVGRPAVPFNDEEVRVASAFADQATLALMRARLTDALQLRLRLVDALSRLDDAILKSSDLRSVLRTLNRKVGREIGVKCVRLAFVSGVLAEVLRTPTANGEEREYVRAWRRTPQPKQATVGDLLAVAVMVHGRPAGILWVKADPIDTVRLELIRAMASAIGEVAYKMKLRRKAEQIGRELAISADRERIANDLHDTVGQTFFGIGLNLQDVLYDMTDLDLREKLGAIRLLASKGIADVRSAVYALSFVQVRDRGLIPSIQTLVAEFTRATGVYAELKILGYLPPLSEGAQNTLYRVAHEALVNVERHARATGVVVAIGARNGSVELVVRDDGVGLEQREARDWRTSAHFGMRMMAKSVEDAGGQFRAVQMLPRGFRITATVPVAPKNKRLVSGG